MHYFLNCLVGFDIVDDESKPEPIKISPEKPLPHPKEWTDPANPPYDYWVYYLGANLSCLNQFRRSKGMSGFTFRPHCGEAGDIDHLASAYLFAHEINHGIQLKNNIVLQYLYYLSQVGISISPLSNNKLFLEYNANPCPLFFARGNFPFPHLSLPLSLSFPCLFSFISILSADWRFRCFVLPYPMPGLNVTLSTDDPLMLHYTMDPLVEGRFLAYSACLCWEGGEGGWWACFFGRHKFILCRVCDVFHDVVCGWIYALFLHTTICTNIISYVTIRTCNWLARDRVLRCRASLEIELNGFKWDGEYSLTIPVSIAKLVVEQETSVRHFLCCLIINSQFLKGHTRPYRPETRFFSRDGSILTKHTSWAKTTWFIGLFIQYSILPHSPLSLLLLRRSPSPLLFAGRGCERQRYQTN